MCKSMTSEVMWHNTNGGNSISNYDDNNNNDDDSNGNTDNKHKNINNGNIHFCNS